MRSAGLTPQERGEEIFGAGFTDVEIRGDLTGAAYDAVAPLVAPVAAARQV